MPSSDSLAAQCSRARSALLVAAHLAGILDEVRHLPPVGYGSAPSFDGITRPVEDVVSALDDRGISDKSIAARRDLTRAAELIERAARGMDEAITAWDPRAS